MSANNIVRKGNNFIWKGAWATSTAYAVNDSVQQNGSGYICLIGHTSGTFATDLAAGKWSLFVEGVGGNSIQVDCSGGTSDTYGALGGLVNSSNTVYTVSLAKYVSGSLRVYLNGQLQTQGSSEDWVETTPASGTFTFNTAPATGNIIIAMYQFTSGTTGNADTLDGLHSTAFLTPAGAETPTNKVINGDNNTISNIASESLKATVAFSAYRNGALTISDVTFTKVTCNAEVYDLGADYDASTNYRFIAPVKGIYHFEGAVHLQAMADTNRLLVTLYVDGAEAKRGNDITASATGDYGAIVSADFQLNANQYVELYLYYDGTGTKATLNSALYNYFMGHLVGIVP